MRHQHRFYAMTVGCDLSLYGLEQTAAQLCAGLIEQNTRNLEQRYNFHHSNSWLNQAINERLQASVEIDAECFEILSRVRSLSEITEGLFDISVATLKPRYPHQHPEKKAEYDALMRPFMGLSQWQLSHTEQGYLLDFSNPHCRFDLGGVIKEYAVDRALAIAKACGASGALINFGGDIACMGQKDKGKPFSIAVKNPKQPDEMLFALELKDQALTSSGHYARSYKLGKAEYSHIQGDIASHILQSTVIAPDALTAGIFSTTLTLNPELKLPKDVAKILVDENLKLQQ